MRLRIRHRILRRYGGRRGGRFRGARRGRRRRGTTPSRRRCFVVVVPPVPMRADRNNVGLVEAAHTTGTRAVGGEEDDSRKNLQGRCAFTIPI